MSASHVINSSLKPTTQTAVAVPKRKRGTKPSEVNLLKLASQAGGFESKKAAQESLKNAGFVATPEMVESLLTAVVRIRSGHNNRPQRVFLKRLGHIPERTGMNATLSREPVLLPKGAPTIRLISLRKQAVTAVAHSLASGAATDGCQAWGCPWLTHATQNAEAAIPAAIKADLWQSLGRCWIVQPMPV